MTASDGVGYPSTNTLGLTGLTKDVGTPSSGAIGNSGNVDKIVSVEVVIFFLS